MEADVATCHALLDDFHESTAWSPGEVLDPALQRTYTGLDRRVGARYAWSGNRTAGRGSMETVGSSPERRHAPPPLPPHWDLTHPTHQLAAESLGASVRS